MIFNLFLSGCQKVRKASSLGSDISVCWDNVYQAPLWGGEGHPGYRFVLRAFAITKFHYFTPLVLILPHFGGEEVENAFDHAATRIPSIT